MKWLLLALLLCLSAVSVADDSYEQSPQAAAAKHANDFLRSVRLDKP